MSLRSCGQHEQGHEQGRQQVAGVRVCGCATRDAGRQTQPPCASRGWPAAGWSWPAAHAPLTALTSSSFAGSSLSSASTAFTLVRMEACGNGGGNRGAGGTQGRAAGSFAAVLGTAARVWSRHGVCGPAGLPQAPPCTRGQEPMHPCPSAGATAHLLLLSSPSPPCRPTRAPRPRQSPGMPARVLQQTGPPAPRCQLPAPHGGMTPRPVGDSSSSSGSSKRADITLNSMAWVVL